MTNEVWEAFAHGAARDRVAGYFESRDPRHPGQSWAVRFEDPDAVVTLHRNHGAAQWEDAVARLRRSDPSAALIGFLGFDAVSLFDPLYGAPPETAPFPLGEFAVVRRTRVRRVSGPPRPSRSKAPLRSSPRLEPEEGSLSRREFEAGVRHLKSAIFAGEAYQVVLAHRRRFERPEDLLERAAQLRERERFEFFYYLKFADTEVIGASPESVVEMVDGRAFINPIAGTRPTPIPRHRLALRADPKELAEHRMLVDLARNDLGHVARPGSVRLVERERRVRYARLEHLVSRVACRLTEGAGAAEVLPAAFPAGTVTGAPKIRATRLLRAEEKTWRGPYGGAVGAVFGGGRASFALAIRSAFTHRDSLYTAAGAGVVAGSEPAREYQETLAKLAEVEATLVGRRAL